MNVRKRIVLDANILLRVVFGKRVRGLLERFSGFVTFFVPDVCIEDARTYIPVIAAKRNFDVQAATDTLDLLLPLFDVVDRAVYEDFAPEARMRMQSRDIEDWPILATSLLLACPIWTEDRDFFGSGVATWTTETVELYLQNEA